MESASRAPSRVALSWATLSWAALAWVALVWGALCLALPGRAAAGDWPMWRYDGGRTAASPNELPDHMQRLWDLELPALEPVWEDPLNRDLMQFDRAYEPVVAGKTLFIGSSLSARVTAYDTDTGIERWRFYTGGPVRLPPVATAGRVLFTSDDGYLYCLDAEDGALRWRFRGGPSDARVLGNGRLVSMWPARGGPVVEGDTVYFAASIWPFMGTFVHALDVESGEVLWTNDSSGSLYLLQPHNSPAYGGVGPQGALVVDGDRLLVPGGRSVPACFDRHTGEFIYYRHANFNKTGGAFVAAVSGRFFNYHRDLVTSLYDGASGDRLMAKVTNVPVLTPEAIYAQGDTIRAWDFGGLRQVEYSRQVEDGDTGQLLTVKDHKWAMDGLWRLGVDARGDLIKAGDRLYAAGGNAVTAVALTPTPRVAWRESVEGEIARLVAADDKLFAVTLEGRIHAFGAGGTSSATPWWRGLANAWRAVFGADDPDVTGDIAATDTAADAAAADAPAAVWAEAILSATEMGEGYGVVYGLRYGNESGEAQARNPPVRESQREGVESASPADRLVALTSRSDLYLVAVVADAGEADRLRRELDERGLYGRRVAVQVGEPATFELPPYMANLIALAGTDSVGRGAVERIYASLRPYGGTAHLPTTAGEAPAALAQRVESYGLSRAVVRQTAGGVALTREGKLPGAADWTHQYGDIANTVKSDDELVRLPLGLLWFGGSSNEDVLPRHGHGPPEQVIGGRLFIEGLDCISARDVYTGRVLWKRVLPELGTFGVYYDETYAVTPLSTAYNQIHIPGANSRGTNYVATADGIYVALGGHCLVLDPGTGDTLRRIDLPPLGPDGVQPPWGYIGVYEDCLIAGAGEVQFTDFLEDVPEGKKRRFYDLDLTASKHLVVMDRQSGAVLWSRASQLGFRHNAIAAGGGRLYCIDRLPEPVDGALRRRGIEVRHRPSLLAVDVRTGAVQWQTQEGVFGTWLSYSKEHDILLQAGRPSRDMVIGEVNDGMAAYRGRTGTPLWTNEAHYGGPCILHGETIITDHYAYDLLSGEQKLRRDPLTGVETPWAYTRRYGCNYAVASEHLLTFRSATGGYYDLANDGGTGNLGGFKSGCTSNLVVADGVLNAPDYTRTCSCSYPNQTSLALIHMPGVEQWVTYYGAAAAGAVRDIGINLGAPGNRRAPDGRFWVAHPLLPHIDNPEKESGLSVAVEVVAPPSAYYTRHVSSTEGPLNWVAASGCRGVERVEVALNTTEPVQCRVDLVFAEPEFEGPGQRRFDLRIEGETLARDVDVYAAAGGHHRALVQRYDHIAVSDGALTVELSPSGAGSAPAILSGLAISVRD